jgi:hypothetical protein
MLEENVTPALRVAIRQRRQEEAQLYGPERRPASLSADIPTVLNLRDVRGSLVTGNAEGREATNLATRTGSF